MNHFKQKLIEKIKKKKVTVTVIGLGYVGLPFANLILKNKFKCIGIDLSPIIRKIKKKKNTKISITHLYNSISNSDIIIYTLPTPLNKKQNPDLKILKNSISRSSRYYKKGQLIILESTSYPGTTRELFKPLEKKFKIGKDIFVGFSSERIDPGNIKFTIDKIPKVISGYRKNCLQILDTFYKNLFNKVYKASNLEIAEMSKIFENVFRAVNISLVNEIKELSKKLDIDFNEVVNLAATKPFGFMKFEPGIGAGGHCIPIDPIYLQWKLKMEKLNSKILNTAINFNKNYTTQIFKEIKFHLDKFQILSKKKKILILGLAYKKNIDDIRHSPAHEIFQRLKTKVDLSYHDPHVKKIRIGKDYFKSIKLDNNFKILKNFSAIIFLVNHDYYRNKNYILKSSNLIIDGTNSFKSIKCINI